MELLIIRNSNYADKPFILQQVHISHRSSVALRVKSASTKSVKLFPQLQFINHNWENCVGKHVCQCLEKIFNGKLNRFRTFRSNNLIYHLPSSRARESPPFSLKLLQLHANLFQLDRKSNHQPSRNPFIIPNSRFIDKLRKNVLENQRTIRPCRGACDGARSKQVEEEEEPRGYLIAR